MIIWYLDLQLPMQSLPITTKIVSLNPTHAKVYSIQYYVIKFVSDLWQVGGFLRALRFPSPIKSWPPRYKWQVVGSEGEGGEGLSATHLCPYLNTHGGKETHYIQYWQLLLFQKYCIYCINKMIRSVTRSCLPPKSSILKPCFWPLFIVCTLMFLLWI